MENVFQAAVVEEEEDETPEPKDRKQSQGKKYFNQMYAEEISSKTLASYGDVCAALRNPQRGLSALYYFKSKSKAQKSKPINIKNVNVYNSLLKGFARKGDYSKIKEVLELMKTAGVPMNIQSHIYVLECLGKINFKDSHLKEIRLCVNELFGQNISFDQLFNEGIFCDGQRDVVLQAVTSHTPSYKPTYVEPEIQYSNNLVNHLNNVKQLDNCCFVDRKRLFTAEDLAEAAQRQIELEKCGYVTVSFV